MNNTFIIAEAGINHNGNLDIAKKMIDFAANAGVDAVKFQTFCTDSLVCKNAPKAKYQIETAGDESQFEMLKKCELTKEAHKELMKYCNDKKVAFLASPFDLGSIDILKDLGMEIVKIPSGEITNYPYLKKISELFDNIILSTGMCKVDEINRAIELLQTGKAKNITLLQCNSQYPTPVEDANLKAMITLKKEFGFPVGYSDHTLGIEVSVAAVAMGASVIEKHFTLDRNMEGPDHKASILPDELGQLVRCIRNIEKAIGDGVKQASSSEYENILIARKSIVAAVPIKKGERLTDQNLTTKRPGTGISPMKWNEIIGTFATRDYDVDDMIRIEEDNM